MNTATKILIAVLLITNISSMGALWFSHAKSCKQHTQNQGQPKHDGPKKSGIDLLAKDLGFTNEQTDLLQTLRKAHFEKAQALDKQIHETRRAIHQLIKEPNVSQQTIDSMATQIGSTHRELEMLVFNHFMEIKAICTPAQQKQFDETLDKILDQMRPPNAPRPPGGEHGGPHGKRPPAKQ